MSNIVDPHPGGGGGGWRVRCCLLSSKGGQVDTDGYEIVDDDDDDGGDDDDDDGVYFLPEEDRCLLTNKINEVTTVNFSDTRCGSEFMAVTSKIVLSRWARADTLQTNEH